MPGGEAVIVDDGGSTKIRWIKSAVSGAMDGLLDVDDATGQSSHELNGSFPDGFIACQGADGHVKEIAMTSPVKKIVVSSDLGQTVEMQNAGGNLKIKLYGDPHRPMVYANQHRKKHRYFVSNSGAIEKVTVDGTVIFDIGAGIPAGIPKTVLHTSVVLSKP